MEQHDRQWQGAAQVPMQAADWQQAAHAQQQGAWQGQPTSCDSQQQPCAQNGAYAQQPVYAQSVPAAAAYMQPASEPPRRKKGRISLVIMIVCLVVMAVCAGIIAKILLDYHEVDVAYEELRTQSGRDIAALQALNPDAVGWVYVADTNIDYPVMFTPDDPEYYLHRNFDRERSSAGTPFVGEGCIVPGGNSTIIYGHHMRSGSMFATLLNFEDEDFFNTHEISFTTTQGEGTYKPIAAFHTDLSHGDGYYRYWEHVGNLNAQEYADFVNTVVGQSMFAPTVEATYGHELLTLSTCSYGTSEERFAVVAVRVDK